MGNRISASILRQGRVIATVAVLALLAVPALAGEMAAKGRNIQSKAESSWTQVGENQSHGIGTYTASGLTFHEGGEISTYTSYGMYDWNGGSDWHRGYIVRSFADGSTTTAQYEGTTASEAGETTWEGTYSFVGGTGRFGGIKGGGTYSGRRYPNKMGITEWEGKIILPD